MLNSSPEIVLKVKVLKIDFLWQQKKNKKCPKVFLNDPILYHRDIDSSQGQLLIEWRRLISSNEYLSNGSIFFFRVTLVTLAKYFRNLQFGF